MRQCPWRTWAQSWCPASSTHWGQGRTSEQTWMMGTDQYEDFRSNIDSNERHCALWPQCCLQCLHPPSHQTHKGSHLRRRDQTRTCVWREKLKTWGSTTNNKPWHHHMSYGSPGVILWIVNLSQSRWRSCDSLLCSPRHWPGSCCPPPPRTRRSDQTLSRSRVRS